MVLRLCKISIKADSHQTKSTSTAVESGVATRSVCNQSFIHQQIVTKDVSCVIVFVKRIFMDEVFDVTKQRKDYQLTCIGHHFSDLAPAR